MSLTGEGTLRGCEMVHIIQTDDAGGAGLSSSCGMKKAMDYPRFERIPGPPERRHLAYHGGRVVELVLGLADVIASGWPGRVLRSAVRRWGGAAFDGPPASRQPAS
jgi:hypothetical protein